MIKDINYPHFVRNPAIRIAFIYGALGVLWILLSDRIAVLLANDFSDLNLIQSVKGWLFVIITTIVLYRLIKSPMLKNYQVGMALRENERKYRTLVEEINDVIFSVNRRGIITYISPVVETMLGYKPDEMTGNLFVDYISTDHRDKLVDEFDKRLSGVVRPFEYRILSKDGRERWVRSVTRPIVENEGIVGIRGILADIDENKKIELELETYQHDLERRVRERTAELEQANADLKDFAYVVAHDLKAPLRGVNQLSGWILEDYKDSLDSTARERFALLGNRVRRMHQLIDAILDYSKIGREKEKPVLVNLNDLIGEYLACADLPEHIQVRLLTKLPTLKYDKTRLSQLFGNLLNNALKFMDKPKGDITVSHEKQEGFYLFKISDNGPGIDSSYHERIFEMFQTLNTDGNKENTGIGLTLVKKIVKLLGGKIWLESEKGKGTTFFFTLPGGEAC